MTLIVKETMKLVFVCWRYRFSYWLLGEESLGNKSLRTNDVYTGWGGRIGANRQTDEMLGVLTTEMAAYLRRVLPYFCS